MNWFIILFLIISIILFLITKYYVEKIDADEQTLKEEIDPLDTNFLILSPQKNKQ